MSAAKLELCQPEANGHQRALFFCPGCKEPHTINVGPGGWSWNRSLDAPTVQPSIMVDRDRPERRCHSYVTDGRIQFLTDCHHGLAGQTVDLPAWEGWP